MRYSDTKWNQEKIENIMNKYNLCFESNEYGAYSDSYMEFYGKKRRVQISIMKSSITVESISCGYWKGISSYKKFEEVLEYYNKIIKDSIWRNLTFLERIKVTEGR